MQRKSSGKFNFRCVYMVTFRSSIECLLVPLDSTSCSLLHTFFPKITICYLKKDILIININGKKPKYAQLILFGNEQTIPYGNRELYLFYQVDDITLSEYFLSLRCSKFWKYFSIAKLFSLYCWQ